MWFWLAGEAPAETGLLETIGLPDLGNLSGYAIGVMCFLAIITGRLYTRVHYNDMKSIAEKWEAAYWKEKEAGALQDLQNAELIETARTMKHFMEAFPKALAHPAEGEKG